MELIPNVIYSNPALAGGNPVTHPDIIRIFYEFCRTIKVRRSMIYLSFGSSENHKHYYTCYNADIATRINGVRVRVRGLLRDPSSIWVYDLKTDEFIIKLKERITPYGDADSAVQQDINMIMAHAQQIKGFKNNLNIQTLENDRRMEDLYEDRLELKELKIIE